MRLVCSALVLAGYAQAQTLNLHAQLTLGKKDDKAFIYDEALRLHDLAKKEKLDPSLLRFVLFLANIFLPNCKIYH